MDAEVFVKCDIVTFTELKDLSTCATTEIRNILITSEHKVILDVNYCVNISNIKLEFNNRLRLYFMDRGTSRLEDKFKLILLNYLLMIIIITDVLGSILMF